MARHRRHTINWQKVLHTRLSNRWLLAIPALAVIGATGAPGVIVIGLGAAGWCGWRFQQRRKAALANQQTQQKARELALEKEIIRLAYRLGGRLTATEVAAHTSLTIDQAEAWLHTLTEKRFATMTVNERGVNIFTFHFQTPPNPPQGATPPNPPQGGNSEPQTVPGFLTCCLTGKQRLNTPEEQVRQNALAILMVKGYVRQDMAIEFPIKMGRARKRADIVIFMPGAEHEQEYVQIVIETKAAAASAEDLQEGKEQLASYVAACLNCRFAALIAAKWQVYAVRVADGRRRMAAIADLPEIN